MPVICPKSAGRDITVTIGSKEHGIHTVCGTIGIVVGKACHSITAIWHLLYRCAGAHASAGDLFIHCRPPAFVVLKCTGHFVFPGHIV